MQVVVLWNVIVRLLEIKGDGGRCQGFEGEGVSALSHKYELKVKTEIRKMFFLKSKLQSSFKSWVLNGNLVAASR